MSNRFSHSRAAALAASPAAAAWHQRKCTRSFAWSLWQAGHNIQSCSTRECCTWSSFPSAPICRSRRSNSWKVCCVQHQALSQAGITHQQLQKQIAKLQRKLKLLEDEREEAVQTAISSSKRSKRLLARIQQLQEYALQRLQAQDEVAARETLKVKLSVRETLDKNIDRARNNYALASRLEDLVGLLQRDLAQLMSEQLHKVAQHPPDASPIEPLSQVTHAVQLTHELNSANSAASHASTTQHLADPTAADPLDAQVTYSAESESRCESAPLSGQFVSSQHVSTARLPETQQCNRVTDCSTARMQSIAAAGHQPHACSPTSDRPSADTFNSGTMHSLLHDTSSTHRVFSSASEAGWSSATVGSMTGSVDEQDLGGFEGAVFEELFSGVEVDQPPDENSAPGYGRRQNNQLNKGNDASRQHVMLTHGDGIGAAACAACRSHDALDSISDKALVEPDAMIPRDEGATSEGDESASHDVGPAVDVLDVGMKQRTKGFSTGDDSISAASRDTSVPMSLNSYDDTHLLQLLHNVVSDARQSDYWIPPEKLDAVIEQLAARQHRSHRPSQVP